MLLQLDDMLNYVKIDGGTFAPETRSFDLYRLANGAVAALRAPAAERGIVLALRIDPQLPYQLRGWPHQLRQILICLITNAVRHSGKAKVRINLDAVELDADRVMLRLAVASSVADNRLETVDEDSDDLGRPLGLAVADRLVGLMGGRLAVEPDARRGLSLTVELPFAIDQASLALPLDLAHLPVLIVTKDAEFVGDLIEPLEAWRADPRWIGAGDAALAYLESFDPGGAARGAGRRRARRRAAGAELGASRRRRCAAPNRLMCCSSPTSRASTASSASPMASSTAFCPRRSPRARCAARCTRCGSSRPTGFSPTRLPAVTEEPAPRRPSSNMRRARPAAEEIAPLRPRCRCRARAGREPRSASLSPRPAAPAPPDAERRRQILVAASNRREPQDPRIDPRPRRAYRPFRRGRRRGAAGAGGARRRRAAARPDRLCRRRLRRGATVPADAADLADHRADRR